MVEASPVKFYMAKYFFLVVGILQWAMSSLLFYMYGWNIFNIVAVTFLVFLGLFLVFLFVSVSGKIKRVRIGENKFVILEEDYNIRFGWPEIKSFRLIPFLNLCKVRIRGRKGSFYFFSTAEIRKRLENFIADSTDVKNKLI